MPFPQYLHHDTVLNLGIRLLPSDIQISAEIIIFYWSETTRILLVAHCCEAVKPAARMVKRVTELTC